MIAGRPNWSFQTKLVVSLLLLALFIYLVFRFSVTLTPMILAVILAYILSPLTNVIQDRLRLRRGAATLISYLVMLVFFTALPMVFLPPLISQFQDLNLDLQRLLQRAREFLGHPYTIAGQTIDGEGLIQQLSLSFQSLLQPVVGHSLSIAVEVVSSIVWVIFILIVSFYLVKDGPALRLWLEMIPPPQFRQDFSRLRDEINQIWAAFFRGQLVLASVVAILFTIIGFALGLPFALAMGFLAGLLEFFPSIGHGIWLTIASFLAFFIGSTWLPLPNWVFALIVIGLHLVFQQFDLNYLIPRIIGRRVHLPPLVVILGIVAGAVMAGVLGIPLAAPTIASARVLGRYVYANLFDLDPFPEGVAHTLPPPNPRWWQAARKKSPEGSA